MKVKRDQLLLIKLEITGQLKAKDRNILENWKNQSEANLDKYIEYKKKLSLVHQLEAYNEIDLKKSWLQFNKKISPKQPRSFKRWLYPSGIAAASIIIIFIAFGNYNKKQVPLTPIKGVAISTNNGNLIDVEKLDELEVINVEGAKLTKIQNKLFYTDNIASKSEKHTLVVPRGHQYEMTLADGTMVYVNSNSKIIYPTTFIEGTRKIWIEKGEIFIDVKHNPEKAFIINVRGLDIEVLGTRFNINAETDNEIVKVALQEGKIKVHPSDSKSINFKPVEMHPGQMLSVNYQTKKLKLEKVDIEMEMAWMNGSYYFENESLKSIMRVLSNWHDYDIVFENVEYKEIKYSGRLEKANHIKTTLEALSELGQVVFEIKENKIIVK